MDIDHVQNNTCGFFLIIFNKKTNKSIYFHTLDPTFDLIIIFNSFIASGANIWPYVMQKEAFIYAKPAKTFTGIHERSKFNGWD